MNNDTRALTRSNSVHGFRARWVVDARQTNEAMIPLYVVTGELDLGRQIKGGTWTTRSKCEYAQALGGEALHLGENVLTQGFGDGYGLCAGEDMGACSKNAFNLGSREKSGHRTSNRGRTLPFRNTTTWSVSLAC